MLSRYASGFSIEGLDSVENKWSWVAVLSIARAGFRFHDPFGLWYWYHPNQDPYFTNEQPVNLLHTALTYNVGASLRMALGVDVYDCYFDKNAAKYIVVGDSNGSGGTAYRTIEY